MKIKEIVKQILKEESDNFEWLDDYGIVPEKNAIPKDDVLLGLVGKVLKGKKSYSNKDYIVGKEEGHGGEFYYIAEKVNSREGLSYFIYETEGDFNLNHIKELILDASLPLREDSTVALEYEKLFDDMKELFVV